MRMRLLVALAAGLMLGSAPPPDWGEVAETQVIPPGSRWLEEDTDCIWEFQKDGRLRVTERDGDVFFLRYILDRTAHPPRFDMVDEYGLCKGIYRVEGDRLLIYIADTGKKRPTRFPEQSKRGKDLIAFKRLK